MNPYAPYSRKYDYSIHAIKSKEDKEEPCSISGKESSPIHYTNERIDLEHILAAPIKYQISETQNSIAQISFHNAIEDNL